MRLLFLDATQELLWKTTNFDLYKSWQEKIISVARIVTVYKKVRIFLPEFKLSFSAGS